LSQTKRL